MELNKLGVFGFLDSMSGSDSTALANRTEKLGYEALWLVESGVGRDALAHAAYLLARTERLVVGSGVASVWAREPVATASGAWTNAELSGGRFVLGIGINNPDSAALRGKTYQQPVAYMAEYVGKLHAFQHHAVKPPSAPPIVIGAQNSRMLELAGRETNGALTYFVTPAHTARARRLIGPSKWLLVEQAVILETDSAKARNCARNYLAFYLAMSGYRKFAVGLGFDVAGPE